MDRNQAFLVASKTGFMGARKAAHQASDIGALRFKKEGTPADGIHERGLEVSIWELVAVLRPKRTNHPK